MFNLRRHHPVKKWEEYLKEVEEEIKKSGFDPLLGSALTPRAPDCDYEGYVPTYTIRHRDYVSGSEWGEMFAFGETEPEPELVNKPSIYEEAVKTLIDDYYAKDNPDDVILGLIDAVEFFFKYVPEGEKKDELWRETRRKLNNIIRKE